MRPWQHSLASVAQLEAEGTLGQSWERVLPLHEFLDLSKTGCADRRHRLMLHHCDLGLTVAQRAFPELDNTPSLVRQHVREDLGHEANFDNWLAGVEICQLPQPVARRIDGGPDGVAQLVINRLTGSKSIPSELLAAQNSAARQVAAFLWLPLSFSRTHETSILSIFMNCVGPSLVRSVFGPPTLLVAGKQRVITDYAWIAEATIMACYGRIPNFTEVVDRVASEPTRKQLDRCPTLPL